MPLALAPLVLLTLQAGRMRELLVHMVLLVFPVLQRPPMAQAMCMQDLLALMTMPKLDHVIHVLVTDPAGPRHPISPTPELFA